VAEFRVSADAEAQIDEILDWSQSSFGPEARQRYAALLTAAMQNVADEPRQVNVHWRRLRRFEAGIHHIGHSRDRVSERSGRVGEPRHYLIFRLGKDGIVEILGFVHERMLFKRAFRRITQR
jgi:toxin ParE1/3/4